MAATGIEGKIAEALLQRLAALVLSPALPVAYPDIVFPPVGTPQPTTWLEAAFMRAATAAVGVSKWNEHPGILQVTVVAKQGAGAIASANVADQIADWFKRGTRLVDGGVQIDVYAPPQIASSYADDPYTRTPVSIRYRVFTP